MEMAGICHLFPPPRRLGDPVLGLRRRSDPSSSDSLTHNWPMPTAHCPPHTHMRCSLQPSVPPRNRRRSVVARERSGGDPVFCHAHACTQCRHLGNVAYHIHPCPYPHPIIHRHIRECVSLLCPRISPAGGPNYVAEWALNTICGLANALGVASRRTCSSFLSLFITPLIHTPSDPLAIILTLLCTPSHHLNSNTHIPSHRSSLALFAFHTSTIYGYQWSYWGS